MIQVLSHSTALPGESASFRQLLEAGADSILLRKPGWQEAAYEQLLLETDPSCYPQIMIAGYPSLCKKYGLMGIHLGEAARALLSKEEVLSFHRSGWLLSTSIHAVETLQIVDDIWDQLLLAPVFDSISKPGHNSPFGQDFHLQKDGYPGRVLALGGIDLTTAAKARNMQFDGIALLGAIWKEPAEAISNFCRIRDIWRTHVLS